jgi:D-xylono/L-arabinono-1,4-lactonase
MADVERIVDDACTLAEGPIWHADRQLLYWLDIPEGRVYQYAPATGEHALAYEADQAIGALTIEADGALLLWMHGGRVARWDGQCEQTVIESVEGHKTDRYNDAIADPEGRVFAGIMVGGTPDADCLYRVDTDRSVRKVVGRVGRTNGLGFTLDGAGLYYTDTHQHAIRRYTYDRAGGEIADMQIAVRTPDGVGGPDGMTVDSEGFIWSAMWGGGCVLRFTPDGRVDRRIAIPAERVSSVAFGGAELTELYITTAGGQDKEQFGSGAGAVFRLRVDTPGQPEFCSRLTA